MGNVKLSGNIGKAVQMVNNKAEFKKLATELSEEVSSEVSVILGKLVRKDNRTEIDIDKVYGGNGVKGKKAFKLVDVKYKDWMEYLDKEVILLQIQDEEDERTTLVIRLELNKVEEVYYGLTEDGYTLITVITTGEDNDVQIVLYPIKSNSN